MKSMKLGVLIFSLFFVLGSNSLAEAATFSFNLYNPPVVKVTVRNSSSYRYEYKAESYTWYNTSVRAKQTHSTSAYNRAGQLTNRSGYEHLYDRSGRLTASAPIRRFYERYTYNAANRLVAKLMTNSFYDSRYKLQFIETYNITQVYHADGSLAEVRSAFQRIGADRKITDSSTTLDVYAYLPDGSSYKTHYYYGSTGKLLGQTTDITVVSGLQTEQYRVVYDVDSSGVITYTHTFLVTEDLVAIYPNQPSPNDLPGLSGQGYRAPVDIVSSIKNPPSQNKGVTFNVTGDLKLNSSRTWSFSDFTINTTGSTFMTEDTSGYDIDVVGDLEIISEGDVDLSIYDHGVRVSGNLTIKVGGALKLLGTAPINVGGTVFIDSGNVSNSGTTTTNTSGNTGTFAGGGNIVVTPGSTISGNTGTLTLAGETSFTLASASNITGD